MTFELLLLQDHSRSCIDQIGEIVSQRPELFDSLWDLFLRQEDPISRRAAWAIDVLTETNNLLNTKHLDTLTLLLPTFKHDAYKRHSLRMIERNTVSEYLAGGLLSICFQWLESALEPIAVKMYSMKILAKMAQKEPFLCRELIDIIEIQMPEATPGFRSIGIKTIKNLQKIEAILLTR